MTPQMMDALQRISVLYALEPEVIFQQIAHAIADVYGQSCPPHLPDTMAMINLADGSCMKFRAVVNAHPALIKRTSLDMDRTLCQFALQSNSPLLIQNAATHPDFCRHLVTRLKLRRYLGVPVCSPDGRTIGTLCFLDDRTDELLGEEDIQFLSLLAMRVSAEIERERMIDARISEHRRYARQLEETAAEKRDFVSMVIHDLRHPLTAMRTSMYLLRSELDANRRSAYLDVLENRTRALGTLLDELIIYDQIEAGKPMFSIEEVELAAMIRDCVSEIGGVSDEQPVPVICDIGTDLGRAEIDAGKLRHILINLVANALKFTTDGCVTVRAHPIGCEFWRLEVEDTGIGMNDDEQQLAFEAYYSGSSQDSGGIGLGLTIARRLSLALGARVTVSSSPGKGSAFHIDFPRRFQFGAATQ